LRIVDTNVISELTRRDPDDRVVKFLRSLDPANTYITSVNVQELVYGIEILPAGKNRAKLVEAIRKIIDVDFYGRILPYGAEAAIICGELLAAKRKLGVNAKLADTQIAAIAVHAGYTLITRNTQDFQFEGLQVFNPWTD
jgi:toxin FitB